jgi:uncharacterized SAM-binding protein YcdF (DUF218 family)
MLITDDIHSLLQLLWDYHHLEHVITPADCMIVMGSQDLNTARKAATLFHQGMTDLLVFSGGQGKITKTIWQQSEASLFAETAKQAGVPQSSILLENQSSNCAENILFSMQLLATRLTFPQRVILVCKPYLQRRAFATFKLHYPNIEVSVTSQNISLLEYIKRVPDVEQFINLMVGDLQRILLYPAKGYQISQAVPESVQLAFEKLVDLGYTQQLLDKA